MSKTLIGVVVLGVTATAAVATPVALLVNKGEGTGGGSRGFKEPEWDGKKIELVHSKDIKTKYKNVDCLKEYYGEEINWGEDGTQSEDKLDLKFIGKNENNLKGCLTVEYYKYSYQDRKWWGGFRLIWTLANDNEGLITVFNSNAKDGNFKFDSSVYVVERGDDNKWISKYKYERQEETITNEENLLKKFPQASNSMFTETGQDYWGFSPVLGKVCEINECQENSDLYPNKTDEPLRWNWQKNTGGSDTVSGWCKNFDDWFNSLFPKGKDTTLKTQLKTLNGTWSKQT